MLKAVKVIIRGNVQGVFFRAQTKQKADELKLVGWVRNEKDDTVKILAEGEEENLKKLIDYCQEGPKFAKVEEVKIEWSEASNEFTEFTIRYE